MNLGLIAPEIAVIALALGILLIDLWIPAEMRVKLGYLAGFGLVVPSPFRASARAIRIQSSSFWDSEFIGIKNSVVAHIAPFFREEETGLSPGFQPWVTAFNAARPEKAPELVPSRSGMLPARSFKRGSWCPSRANRFKNT